MILTYADKIERLSPAQCRAKLEADYLSQHVRLSTPAGRAVVQRQLVRLRGVGETRAAQIITHALTY